MPADNRLSELLLRWQELRERGQPASAEELCRDCPDLVEPLRQQMRTLHASTVALQASDGTHDPTLVHAAPRPTTPTTPTNQAVPPPLPKRIGPYEVLGCLGEGGMGTVYKARQPGLDRLVALKVIRGGSSVRAQDLARFRTEAQAIAQLSHPNLVSVYEVGEHDGVPFLVMELVDGVNLEQHAAGKPQPPRQAAQMVETLARALHAVHDKGIIHRDLKPANVLLTAAGFPKLSDFGLAKRFDSDQGPT